jgi:hypothetical protein
VVTTGAGPPEIDRKSRTVEMRNLLVRLGLSLPLAAATLGLWVAAPQAATWTVTESKGVVLSLVSGQWQEVELGSALEDPTLRSLRGARLELQFSGTTVELGPDSAVRLRSRPGGAVTVQHYAGLLEVTGSSKEQVLVQAGGMLVAHIAGSVDVRVNGAVTTVLVEAGNASVKLADNGFVSVSAGHLATGNDDTLTVADAGSSPSPLAPEDASSSSGRDGQGATGQPGGTEPTPHGTPNGAATSGGGNGEGTAGDPAASGNDGGGAGGNSSSGTNAGGNSGNSAGGNGASNGQGGGGQGANGDPPGSDPEQSDPGAEPSGPAANGQGNGNGQSGANPGSDSPGANPGNGQGNGAANGNGSGGSNGSQGSNGNGGGNGNGNGNLP